MGRGFWSIIWSSYMKTQGPLLSFLSILSTLIAWAYAREIKISFFIVFPISLLLLTIIITFYVAAYDSFQRSKQILPKVICVKNLLGKIILLLEPSELFSYNCLISCYHLSDEFEELIAVGMVHNIQIDGKIQVILYYLLKGHEDVFKKLGNSDSILLKQILVKPNVPKDYVDLNLKEGVWE